MHTKNLPCNKKIKMLEYHGKERGVWAPEI